MSDPLWMNEEWKADSLKWCGEVLKGEFAHWCNDWDGLPVDETCSEFECCTCFPGNAAEPPTETLLDRWDEQDRKARDTEAGREDPVGASGAGGEE